MNNRTSPNQASDFQELVNLFERLELINLISKYISASEIAQAEVQKQKLFVVHSILLSEAKDFSETQLLILRVMKLGSILEPKYWRVLLAEDQTHLLSCHSESYLEFVRFKSRLIFFQSHVPVFIRLINRNIKLVDKCEAFDIEHLVRTHKDDTQTLLVRYAPRGKEKSRISLVAQIFTALGDLGEILSVIHSHEIENTEIDILTIAPNEFTLSINKNFAEHFVKALSALASKTDEISQQSQSSILGQLENMKHFGTQSVSFLDDLSQRLGAITNTLREYDIRCGA